MIYFKELDAFGGEGGLGIDGGGFNFFLISSLLLVSSFILFSTLKCYYIIFNNLCKKKYKNTFYIKCSYTGIAEAFNLNNSLSFSKAGSMLIG